MTFRRKVISRHVGSRFAAGNKGRCMVRRKGGTAIRPLLSYWKPRPGLLEPEYFARDGQHMKQRTAASLIHRSGPLVLALVLLSGAANAQTPSDGVSNFLGNIFSGQKSGTQAQPQAAPG